jgi:hypothetical protein
MGVVNGRSLNPNYAGAFAQGAQTANTLKNQRLAGQLGEQEVAANQAGLERSNQFDKLSATLTSGEFGDGQTRQSVIKDALINNPDKALNLLKSLGVKNQIEAEEASTFGYTLENTPFADRPALIQNRVNEINTLGGDSSFAMEYANMNEQQQNQVAQVTQSAALSTKQRMEQQKKPAGEQAFQKSEQGLVFNPNTGTYSVDPTAKARFDEVAGQKNQAQVIPPVLIQGLNPEIAEQASAAYTAGGGGDKGLKAYQAVIDSGTEQQKRTASPAMLKTSFPQASKAEMAQLQAAMDAAKDTSSGLVAANKVREGQRKTVKAQGFQKKAVDLLTKIIENPQLGDVLGSIEGGYDFRPFSDDETELISDIEEAKIIVTTDNLSLMSGILTDKDINMLKQISGGALNRKRNKDRFITDVTTLRDKLQSEQVVTADELADQRTNNQGPPSGKQGGVLNTDAQGNRAWVFPDGSFEEVN